MRVADILRGRCGLTLVAGTRTSRVRYSLMAAVACCHRAATPWWQAPWNSRAATPHAGATRSNHVPPPAFRRGMRIGRSRRARRANPFACAAPLSARMIRVLPPIRSARRPYTGRCARAFVRRRAACAPPRREGMATTGTLPPAAKLVIGKQLEVQDGSTEA